MATIKRMKASSSSSPSISPVNKTPSDCCLQARVYDAPALGGSKMYQVKLACKGNSTSLYKSKDDFKNVMNMLKLVGAMLRNQKSNQCCPVCAECATMTMPMTCKNVDEEHLTDFLSKLLTKLRSCSLEDIGECTKHRGVIHILMEFLGVRNGKYFCEKQQQKQEAETPVQPEEGEENQQTCVNSHTDQLSNDQPIEKCSLNRTLSQKFAAFDSVC